MSDVIIIGGGISGLSAARLLDGAGLKVLVLEARDRVGGRTHTARDPAYKYVDLGGSYVGPTQRRVGRLAKELGLEFYRICDGPKHIMSFRRAWKTYEGLFPFMWNPFVILDLNALHQKIDKIASEIPVEAPWTYKDAQRLDSMTMSEFIDEICWTEFSKVVLRFMCRLVVCGEPHNLSALWFLWYIASAYGLDRLMSVKDGGQERKIHGGSMQISERMAEQLKEKVKLQSPVVRVELGDSKTIVHTSDGQAYETRYVISAMPLPLVNRVKFEPPLPDKKLQLIQRVPMGCVIKTMLYYDRAYWQEKGYSGQMFTDNGPVLYTLDDTKPDGSHPCIMGFILAKEAVKLSNLSPLDRKKALANHYAECFKIPELKHPINYVEKNWMAEEYAGGCYVANFAPGTLTTFGPYMREPYRRLHFAGTETASNWSGYMDGAVQAGERAAREILHALGKISEDQIWKDEPPLADFEEIPFELSFLEKILPSVPTFIGFLVTAGVAATAAAVHKFIKPLY